MRMIHELLLWKAVYGQHISKKCCKQLKERGYRLIAMGFGYINANER